MRSRMFCMIVSVLIMVYSGVLYAQTPTPTPDPSLVAYYPFNGNADDESGNGNQYKDLYSNGVSGKGIKKGRSDQGSAPFTATDRPSGELVYSGVDPPSSLHLPELTRRLFYGVPSYPTGSYLHAIIPQKTPKPS